MKTCFINNEIRGISNGSRLHQNVGFFNMHVILISDIIAGIVKQTCTD